MPTGYALGESVGRLFSKAIKSPAVRGFFGSGVLSDLNLISLHAFLTFDGHEGHCLTFAQALEA